MPQSELYKLSHASSTFKLRGKETLFAVLILVAAAFFPFLLFFTSGLSFFTFHALGGLMALKHQIAQCFSTGQYPLWNPFIIAGIPFHSGIGILDPFLISYFLFDGIQALLASSYLALLTAGISMYFYLRLIWRCSFAGAIAGSLFYLANPFFAATCHETPFMNPPVFLPLVFLFHELAEQRRQIHYSLLAGLCLGLSFLSGNLESFFFMLLFFGGIQSAKATLESILQKSANPFFSSLKSISLTAIAALAFIAIDLLPTLEMIAYSGRNAGSNIFQNFIFLLMLWAGGIALSLFMLQNTQTKSKICILLGLLTLFLFSVQIHWARGGIFDFNVNLFFPNPHMIFLAGKETLQLLRSETGLTEAALKPFIERRFIFYIQPPIYLFTFASLFIFVVTWIKSRCADIKLLGGFAIGLVLYGFTFVPDLNARVFHLNLIAYPRIVFSFFFIQAIFIAYGLSALTGNIKEERQISLTQKAFRLGLVFLSIGFVSYSVAVLPQFNSAGFKQLLNHFSQNQNLVSRSLAYAALMVETLRLLVHQNGFLFIFGASKHLSLLFLFLLLKRPRPALITGFLICFAIDILSAWNFYTFQRSDIQSVVKPNPATSHFSTLDTHERMGTRNDSAITLFNFYDFDHKTELSGNLPLFFNQRTIEGATLNLSPQKFNEFWTLESKNTYTPTILNAPHSKVYDLLGMKYLFSTSKTEQLPYQIIADGPHYTLYQNTQSLPRFYFAKYVRAATAEEIKSAIQTGDWNPNQLTLIEHTGTELITPPEIESIEILEDSYQQVQLKVKNSSPGYLATTDAFHPHWKATVNGKAQEVIKTNFYFKGLFIPAGEHKIVFYYDQSTLKIGGFISLLALIALFAAGYRRAKKARA